MLAVGGASPASSYESDVHYGLTQWLALKAGFQDWQAQAIATGNFRVDSGLMSTLALLPLYACTTANEVVAREIQSRHYPSSVEAPADLERRLIEPGNSAARQTLATAQQQSKGHEAQYLGLFGAALHPLQDSWAHSGAPSTPSFGPLRCNARLAAVPTVRATDGPHDADLTSHSIANAIAMARATYDALTALEAIKGEQRNAQRWATLEQSVRAFAQARTKSAKREWFVKQGIEDTTFLATTSLPDGAKPGPLKFEGYQLPLLHKVESMQHDAPSDLREFFDQAFNQWLGKEPLDKVAHDLSKHRSLNSQNKAQLKARLQIWKLRDHGSAARLAHLARPFTPAELLQVDALAKKPNADLDVAVERALFPLVIRNPTPSPLLPYVVHQLPGQPGSVSRAIAIARLMHAPRDTIGLIAEKTPDGWALVDLVSVVDQ